MPALAHRTRVIQRSRLHEMHRLLGQPGLISLANGAPAVDLYPLGRIERAFAAALANHSPVALNYSLTEGFEPLREWIALKMRDASIECTAADVLITNGIQQALDLTGRVALDRGDHVIVDDPTYPGLVDALTAFEPRFHPIPMTDNGTDVERIRSAIARDRKNRPFRIKMVYVIPNFHNPTGKTMSVADRKALAALAEEYNLLVVEDDAYGDLRYEAERLPSIKSFDRSGNVVYLGSFSKILAPGIRLGWVITGRRVLEQYVRAKQAADLHTSQLSQVAAYEAAQDCFFEGHIARLVTEYRQRRDALVASIETAFSVETCFVFPQGGFFVWVDFPPVIAAEALFEAAIQQRTVCLPGTWFHLRRGGEHAVRISYSGATPATLAEGVRRLAVAVDTLLGISR